MATITLSELRDRVRFLGTFENSVKFTSTRLNTEINAAWSELYEILEDACSGYWDTTATVPTVAGQDWVPLPSDFWVLKGVDILSGTRYIELDQVGIANRNDFQSSQGRPVAYRTVTGSTRGRLTLYPTPSTVETIRLIYTPTFTPLAADGDTIEGFNDWGEYVVYGALLRCDDREERDQTPTLRRLAAIEARIRKAASKRRSAAPQYLRLDGYEADDLDYL